MPLKHAAALVLTAAAFSFIGMAGAQPVSDKAPMHLSRAELIAKVAKTTDGLAMYTLPTDPRATALAVRRETSGEVEIHKAKDDIFVVQAGGATVLIGDQADGGRETGPGERRGGVIKAPRSYPLSVGDVLWIPAGMAHQVIVAKGKPFIYLAMKFDVPPAQK